MADERLEAIAKADLLDGLTHGACVSRLTYLIAKELKLDDKSCYELALAGLVHDIGKLRLSMYLYGRNNNAMEIEEIHYMRMHSEIGYEILREYDFPEKVQLAVLYHHESYNGSGYPENLKGDEIPYYARVLKVADEFVALTSQRPYRDAYSVDEAIDIMIHDNVEYDIEVFLAFMSVIHDKNIQDEVDSDKLILEFSKNI